MERITEFYSDFKSALAACTPGYDDDELAEVVAHKASIPVDLDHYAPEQATNSIVAVGIAATGITERPLNVLDFGGGCGFHYFHVAAATRMNVRWAIVETPAMAKRAAKLADGRFEVFTEIKSAAAALGEVHLVHASGSIQYVPEPLATIKELAALRAKYFAMARFPIWSGAKIVGLQGTQLLGQGIGPPPSSIVNREIKIPITFENFHDVTKVISDYDIAWILRSESGDYSVGDRPASGMTFVLRLR